MRGAGGGGLAAAGEAAGLLWALGPLLLSGYRWAVHPGDPGIKGPEPSAPEFGEETSVIRVWGARLDRGREGPQQGQRHRSG